MSTTMTLAELRTAARQRADMVNSAFVTDPEFDSYLNQSIFELYDLLVQKFGNDYYVADPIEITTDGSDTYALPNGALYDEAPAIYKLLGVDAQVNGDFFYPLKPFNFADRNRLQRATTGIQSLRYRLRGEKLWIAPTPTAGTVLRLYYVPRLTQLVEDSDTVDGISGWTEYVIIDAAIKALQKEESDVSVLFAQKQAMIARIESAAENRDAGSPATVADTQSAEWDDDYSTFRY